MLLFTIGYEGLDQRQFLAHLIHYGVDMVADVRKFPISRKKGFSKSALTESLHEKNIEYVNIRELGTPKEIREELYASGDYNRFFFATAAFISASFRLVKNTRLTLLGLTIPREVPFCFWASLKALTDGKTVFSFRSHAHRSSHDFIAGITSPSSIVSGIIS